MDKKCVNLVLLFNPHYLNLRHEICASLRQGEKTHRGRFWSCGLGYNTSISIKYIARLSFGFDFIGVATHLSKKRNIENLKGLQIEKMFGIGYNFSLSMRIPTPIFSGSLIQYFKSKKKNTSD